jgi:hypothetical protein
VTVPPAAEREEIDSTTALMFVLRTVSGHLRREGEDGINESLRA